MEPQNVDCPTQNKPAIDIVKGRYRYLGSQEEGIQCIFIRRGRWGEGEGDHVVGRIQGRVFKRMRPDGWVEQGGDRLSLVQTRAGYFALLRGLIGPE